MANDNEVVINNSNSSSMDAWSINCESDGEENTPSAEELESYYEYLEKGVIPELQWQCPGRRAPSPAPKEEPKKVETVEKEAPAKNDFDFMDDVALPQMRVRTLNATPKGSAKKKTGSFAGALDALKKQMSHKD